MDFKDKIVIVTGGAQGIGRCIAEEFEKLGASVCAIDKQQGELNAVLMYQRLAKVVKTDKECETFLQLAKEEGRHASVFHAYTKEAVKPKKTMAIIMPFLYRLLGKKRLYKLIAKGEYDAAVGYEHLIADFPEVESVKNDEKRHGDMVSSLLE